MKRSFLFVGAKPARTSARRCADEGGGSSTSASAPPSTSATARETRARIACSSSGAATRSARNPAETPCLNVWPTTATPASSSGAVRAEAAVVARRVEVAPVEVLGVAREVAAVALRRHAGRARPCRPRSGRSGARRGRGACADAGSGVAHPALLALATKRVANDARDAERLGPQPQPRQVDPAQPADEDRVRVRVRERDGERRAGRGRGVLVLAAASSRRHPARDTARPWPRSPGSRGASRRRRVAS